jgi:hypothetical protein
MRRINVYVASVALLSVLAGSIVYWLRPVITSEQLQASAWFVAMALLAQLQAHRLPAGASGSISFLPLMAVALVTPSWLAVIVAGTAHAVAESLIRRAPTKAIFNVAQVTLSMAVAVCVFWLFGGESLLSHSDLTFGQAAKEILPALLGLVLCFFALNAALVSGVIALSDGKSFYEVWRRNTLGILAYDLLSAPIVLIFGWVYVRFGPLGALGLAIPLLGARQLYKANRQLETINQELLELMVKAIEARDPYTSGHSRRVAHYSKIIARALGLGSKQIDRVATAALLHDVGKIHEVFAPILRKPGKLTSDEWAIMQTHPAKSAELVSTVSHLRDLVSAVRHHHENWDGSGYPDGLSEEGIPLESRIIMFADTIDAMTSDRPYRAALGEADVRAELIRMKGRQFDPDICDALLSSTLFPLLFAPKGPVLEATPLSLPRRMAALAGAS